MRCTCEESTTSKTYTNAASALLSELRKLPQRQQPAVIMLTATGSEEIAVEAKETFLEAGGTEFRHIPCLNDQPAYISFLEGRVRNWLN